MRLRTMSIVTVTAVLLSGVYLAAGHLGDPGTAGVPRDRSYRLDVGAEKAAVKVIEVRQGDRITFVATSAEAGSIYIHSPELESTLVPGVETTLAFTADHSGRYYVHFHPLNCVDDSDEAHQELAVLDVMPD